MRLTKAQVKNFRSIEDSNEFKLGEVTCLVGKNEAGKTALLHALYRLHPHEKADGVFDRDRDYPRRYLTDFDERHPDGKAVAISTTWELDDTDVTALETVLGAKALRSRTVTIEGGFGIDATLGQVDLDEGIVVSNLVKASGLHKEEVTQLATPQTVKALAERLGVITEKSERHQKLIATITQHFSRGTAPLAAIDILAPRWPKFLYFSHYDRMPGQVQLEAFIAQEAAKTLDPGLKVFLAFLGTIGFTPAQLAALVKFEPLIARLESASIKITEQIFSYWTQNRQLKVQFRVDHGEPGDPPPFNTGRIIRTRIFNQHHESTVPFDERSAGFVWFFSFLVYFSQVKKSHGENLIILLDEPGLSLHARAQQDLLRYFNEKLRPRHQVIYTTHSPFMVPTSDLLSVRTVEDVVTKDEAGETVVEGTKVRDDVLATDRDTLFPLQGALGYEITQSLFIGEHTLIVEGPGDLLYLRAFSEELKLRKRTQLDRRWTICPVGGIDKVPAFMALFGANRLHVAILVDLASGQKKKIEELRRSKLLKDGHVFTYDAYTGQPEADVEDVLGADMYVALVNEAYEVPKKRILSAPKGNGRILKYVESEFGTMPPEVPEFDHYYPAEHLIVHRPEFFKKTPELDAALDRFEKIFTDLNALLPESK